MVRINLLPHRAEKRKARQVQYASLSALSVIAALVIVGVVHAAIGARIEYQQSRNQFLKDEIAKLDRQIEELKKLKAQTEALLARKKVVEELQLTRSDAVHLLDQMLRILPEGVYLKTLKQTGQKILVTGITQSNARVSTLMRSIDASPWLDTPSLEEIHVAQSSGGGVRMSEFTIHFNLTKQTAEDAKKAAAEQTSKQANSAPPAANTGQ